MCRSNSFSILNVRLSIYLRSCHHTVLPVFRMDGNTSLVTHRLKTCADSSLERSIRLYNPDLLNINSVFLIPLER